MTRTELSDSELLAATVDVADAFDQFYRRHRDVVLLHLVDRTQSLQSAFDLVSEVFVAAYFERAAFDGQGKTAAEWLIGIARRKLAASRRWWSREHTAARRKLGVPRRRYSQAALARAVAESRARRSTLT
jgi:DNA-directed RNA polymerase specialized sigma24 family protein